VPIATASSAYVLEDRASPTLKAIRQEAERATVALRATATAADKIGAPSQMQRLDRFETKLRGVATTAETTSTRVQRTVGHMEGAIRRDTLKAEARLTSLEERLDAVGRKRATPTVELDGYLTVRAQIASLDRALDSLARRHASPTIGTSIAGGAARAAGGGGRSGIFAGSGGIGAFTSRPALIAGALTLGLPVLGSIPPVAASLTGGALGAGSVGAAGGGALLAGVAGIASVAKPAAAAVKALSKEQEQYNATVAQYGVASKQAAESRRQLNAALAAAPPGAANFLRERTLLASRWQRVTAPGQADILGLGAGAARRVRSAAPFLGAQANVAAGATREQGLNLAGWATSPAGLIIVKDLTRAFADNLDEAEQTLEHVLGTAGNIARASTPFFHEGMVFLERWTGGWERSTRDIGQTRQQIGGYVDDLKAIGHLGGAGFDLIRDLIMPGRQQGTSLVEDLTMQLREWDDWAQHNPERIRRFYHDSIEGTKDLVGLIATLGADLRDVAQILLPILSRFAELGQIAGGTGLLLPTLIRAGLGRAMGGRGGGAPAAAGAVATTAVVAGRMARGGARAPARTPIGRSAPVVYGTGYRSGDALHPAFAPVPTAAGASGRLAGLRGRAIGAAGSVGRFAAPVAAISGVLGAAGTAGTFEERMQGAVSGLTFGLVPAPTTGAMAREQGAARVLGDIEHLGSPASAADYRRQIADLEAKRRRASARSSVGAGGGLFGGHGTLGLFQAGRGGDAGPSETEAKRNAAAVKGYADAIRDLRREQASYRAEEDRRHGVASELHGSQLADSLQTGYGTLRRVRGPESALQDTAESTLRRMRRMRPEGAKVLGESMLAWSREIAKGNPKLQAIVDDMTRGIERRFSRLGDRVVIVNGQILTGTRAEWTQIGAAMTTPAEEAQQKVTKAFTAIQRQAIGSLRAMGFTTTEARGLVRGMEAGKVKAGSPLTTAAGASAGAQTTAGPSGDGIGDGPGTKRRRPIGGTSTRGGLMGAKSGLGVYAQDAAGYGLHVSSGRRPGAITSSGNVSYHSSGDAVDLSGTPADMMRYARHASSSYGSRLEELIHTPLGHGQIKDGRPFVYTGQVARDHFDHVHVADTGVGGLAGGGPGGGAQPVGAGGRSARLDRRTSGLRGAPGALADRAMDVYARALEDRISSAGGGGNVGGARGGGRWAALVAAVGLPSIFNAIIGAESGGDPNARNPSGAIGLTQLLGHGALIQRVARQLGLPADPRIPRVNLGVAKLLYDESGLAPWTASRGAWGNSLGRGRGDGIGWYGRGGSGTARRPTLIGVGDHPRGEDFSVRPTRLGPPSSRAGGRAGAGAVGLATVTIQSMTVNWAREGDLKQAMKDELRQALDELAHELDHGVAADEDALIR
jgi:hypothetical protein